ncbi:hypothetical protein [Escherichia albertii]|uniref:hypothetical protein n=1 Tax=Escherichia albertii TaxID=208962 RepID=UPI000304E9A3|nr:hypothetical protein [Escherichia albertii]
MSEVFDSSKCKYNPEPSFENQQNIANLLKSSANGRNTEENYILPLATFPLCR